MPMARFISGRPGALSAAIVLPGFENLSQRAKRISAAIADAARFHLIFLIHYPVLHTNGFFVQK